MFLSCKLHNSAALLFVLVAVPGPDRALETSEIELPPFNAKRTFFLTRSVLVGRYVMLDFNPRDDDLLNCELARRNRVGGISFFGVRR